MNRLNWMTYLKILFDQLEKVIEPIPIAKKKSFLNREVSYHASKSTLERVNRDSFVKALIKIESLLPLVSVEDYVSKFGNEQAISFYQIENQLMCSQYSNLSWDNLIDLLMLSNNQDHLQSPRSDKSGSNQINEPVSCAISAISKIDNFSLNSRDIGGLSKWGNKYQDLD